MAKRKRGEGGEYGSSEDWQQQEQQQSSSRPQAQQYSSESQALSNSTYGSSAGGVEYAPSSTATHSGPYFYQQTHPNTYNSPWPPSDSTSYASQPSNYSLPAPTNMPYFHTPQSLPDQSDANLDATVPQPSYQNYPAEIEASSQYAYVQNPGASNLSRPDLQSKSPAYLYEDASMHLKIQSLSILENLVR